MDIIEQQIWKTNYVQPMFEKYKEIPTKLKYMFIEKEYCKIFVKSEGLSQMAHMYDDSETFIFAFESALCEFGKVARKNLLKKYFEELSFKEYYELLTSGMFYEFFPNLTGKWLQDKEFFINFVAERENKKEYVKLILGLTQTK